MLGKDSRKENCRSYEDAIDASNYWVRWKFTRSPADLSSNEHIVDIEKLLELALLINDALAMQSSRWVGMLLLYLVYGMEQIMYP